MKQKTKILIAIFTLFLLAAVGGWIFGYDPFVVVVLGCLVLFLVYVLWDMPPKHKTFSYEDQQRAMRAFDRSEQIDMGKPDWAKKRKK